MLGKCGLNAHMGGLLVEKGRGGGVGRGKKMKRRCFLRPFATSLTPFPTGLSHWSQIKFTLRTN